MSANKFLNSHNLLWGGLLIFFLFTIMVFVGQYNSRAKAKKAGRLSTLLIIRDMLVNYAIEQGRFPDNFSQVNSPVKNDEDTFKTLDYYASGKPYDNESGILIFSDGENMQFGFEEGRFVGYSHQVKWISSEDMMTEPEIAHMTAINDSPTPEQKTNKKKKNLQVDPVHVGFAKQQEKEQKDSKQSLKPEPSKKDDQNRLLTYEAAREPGRMEEMFLRALASGVPTRAQKEVYPESPAASKSSISRLWKREGSKLLEEFRARDIRRDDWLILMLDGVRLADDLWVVVALAVAEDGTKHMLDFEIGASENTEVVTALCERLRERGFAPKDGGRFLCVFDGAKALRSAAKKVWGDPVFQRCLVHKERNLKRYLSKLHWGELSRHMNRLRKVEAAEAAREALGELRTFVESKNTQALASLEEAGDELIALHLLEVPNTLHKNLLSTNIIENSMRGTTGRVTRWRKETEQAARWMGLAVTRAEEGFQKLAGYRDLAALAEALKRPAKDAAEAA